MQKKTGGRISHCRARLFLPIEEPGKLMPCPDCDREIGDAAQCECGWPEKPAGSVLASPELSQEPEKFPDIDPSEELEMGPEQIIDPSAENTDLDEDEELAESADPTSIEINNRKSTVRGDQAGILYKNFFIGKQDQKEKSKPSLYTSSVKMPAVSPILPEFVREELNTHLTTLEQKHLLVIECVEPEVAFSTAYSLVDALKITDQQHRRMYDLWEKLEEDAEVGPDFFLPKSKPGKKKTAVVVRVLSHYGQALVSSLINDYAVASYRLIDNEVYLLFLVNPAFITERVDEDYTRDSHFSDWKIACLQYLLKSNFPEQYLEYVRDIEKQQADGRWEKNDARLYYEIKSYIERNKLGEEIERRKRALSSPRPEKTFKDEQYIEKTVIYVATYFPDITLLEFCELVEALLGDRKILATIPKFTLQDDQTMGWSYTSSLWPIIEIWKDHKDQFLWERLREMTSAREMITTVDFTDHSMRDKLRNYLNNKRKLYLKDQFDLLQNQGFLFHPSNRVSNTMIRLTAETAAAYPDEYNKDWLVAMISNLRDAVQANLNGVQEHEYLFFQFLNRGPFNKTGWGYSRIAELIRRLVKDPQTREMVNRAFSDLMRLKMYDAVLNLIMRLRFAPDFDGTYWLRQLFERGEAGIRVHAFNYLYDQVREADASIYETLNKLESWLPGEDREAQKHSAAARIILRLLIKYCLETIYRMKQESDTAEYIQYPLFVFADKKTAEDNLDQLVKWLLHPALGPALRDMESDSGMKNVLVKLGLEKNPTQLLGELMAEWSMILLGSAQAVAAGASAPNNGFDPASPVLEALLPPPRYVDAADLFHLLIERLAAYTNENQRRALIAYWEALNQYILHLMTRQDCSIERRQQLYLKSSQIFVLAQEFKKLSFESMGNETIH
ncbi:MAG: hypothetical protein ACJ74J_02760 [Blastocatellia bacterium]